MSEEKEPVKFIANERLPSIWVDNIKVAKRSDNICALSFYANMPSGHVEQARMFASCDHLKEFLNIMCSSLDYFPEPDQKK
jgi:hypothetical protein